MLIGPLIVGLHVKYITIWSALVVSHTLNVHSGYNFKVLRAQAHDDHHKYFIVNYGILDIFDYIYKTRKQDLKTKFS